MKPKYKQNWSAYNLSQTQELGLFVTILDELIEDSILIRKTLPRRGRPQLSTRDMLFACVLKTYFGKSMRRGASYLEPLKAIRKAPHFTSIGNYFREDDLKPILKHLIETSATPLTGVEQDFAVDSSGFSTRLFGRWFNARLWKKSKKRLWKKVHIISGVKTNIVTSVIVTPGYYGDSPMFRELVEKTSKNFKMREVSADKAYSSKANLELVSSLGAIPYIPFRKTVTGKRAPQIWKAMFKYYDLYREKFLQHYHKRSNVEATFSMIKRKFDYRVFCKSEIGQINEILCKVLCHNICVLIQELFEMNHTLVINFSTKLPVTFRGN